MRKLLIVFIVIVLLIGGAGLFVAQQLDETRLRALITSTANEHLNAELRIEGPLSVSVFPSVGASLSDLHLADPADASRELASAATMRVGVRLRPLLRGSIEIEEISLDDFRLELTRSEEGKSNWENLALPSEALEKLPDPEPAVLPEQQRPIQTSGTGPELTIERLSISNGTIVFDDREADTRYALTEITLNAANVNTVGAPFDVAFSAQLGLNARSPSDLSFEGAGFTVAPEGFDAGRWSLRGPGIVASGHASGSGEHVNAELSLEANLVELLNALDQPVPDAVNQALLKEVQWTVKLSAEGDRLTLEPGTLKLGDTEINLHGDADLGDIPRFNLDIRSALINVDALLPPQSDNAMTAHTVQATVPNAATAAAPDSAGGSGKSDKAPTPFKASISANVERIIAGHHELSNASLSLIATPGRFNISQLNAGLYGGQLKGNAVIDQRQGKAGLTSSATLNGVEIAPLLAASGQTVKAQGQVNANLDITARGQADNWTQTLDGPVNLTLANIRLEEIGTERMLCSALATLNQEALTQHFPASTDFEDVDVKLTFKEGTGSISHFSAAIPNLALRGDGTISLAKSRLDTVFTARITGDLEQLDPACRVTRKMQAIEWPITCRGGFHEAPAEWCRITSEDLGNIATKLTADKVQKKVEDKLKKLLGF